MSIILILLLLLFSPSWSKREPVDGPCVYHHLLMCFLRTSSNTLSIGVTESLDQRINTNDSGRVAGRIANPRKTALESGQGRRAGVATTRPVRKKVTAAENKQYRQKAWITNACR